VTASPVEVVGLDGDDTLWQNEEMFADVETRLRDLIHTYSTDADVNGRLIDLERGNLALFGYGVKAFTLSMIETAIELTDGAVAADDIHRIVGWGKWMLAHPVELLDGVAEVVPRLAGDYRLLLITKGDLFNQEAKVAASGIADHFEAVEIVSEKEPATYQRILDDHGIDPATFVMAGNSVRSDILPVLNVGARAVHIERALTWELETVEGANGAEHGYSELRTIRDLADTLRSMDR
jgi:putative hydrolase of the HAD superfamily